jgi:hypothetical protein
MAPNPTRKGSCSALPEMRATTTAHHHTGWQAQDPHSACMQSHGVVHGLHVHAMQAVQLTQPVPLAQQEAQVGSSGNHTTPNACCSRPLTRTLKHMPQPCTRTLAHMQHVPTPEDGKAQASCRSCKALAVQCGGSSNLRDSRHLHTGHEQSRTDAAQAAGPSTQILIYKPARSSPS